MTMPTLLQSAGKGLQRRSCARRSNKLLVAAARLGRASGRNIAAGGRASSWGEGIKTRRGRLRRREWWSFWDDGPMKKYERARIGVALWRRPLIEASPDLSTVLRLGLRHQRAPGATRSLLARPLAMLMKALSRRACRAQRWQPVFSLSGAAPEWQGLLGGRTLYASGGKTKFCVVASRMAQGVQTQLRRRRRRSGAGASGRHETRHPRTRPATNQDQVWPHRGHPVRRRCAAAPTARPFRSRT